MRWERVRFKVKPREISEGRKSPGRSGGTTGPGKRWAHTCNSVKNGRALYVFGGYGKDNRQTNDIHVFDTAKQTWSKPMAKGTLPSPRDSHSCATVGASLYIFGGTDGKCPLQDLYVLDTVTHMWSKPHVGGDGPAPRKGHSAVLVGHKIFIFGGCGKSADDSKEIYYNDLYVLDTVKLLWIRAITKGTAPTPRDSHTCSAWNNELVVLGGEDASDSYLSDVHILDTDVMEWKELQTTGQKLMPRAGHATVSVGKHIFVFGGFTDDRNLFDDLHMLNIETGVWTTAITTGMGPSARFSVAGDCVDAGSGILVFIGGRNENLEALDDMYYLDTELKSERGPGERLEKFSPRKELKRKRLENQIVPKQPENEKEAPPTSDLKSRIPVNTATSVSSTVGAADVLVPKNVQKNGCLKMVDHGQNALSIEHVASHCKQSLNDLPAWSELGLHWKLIEAMATLGFTQPTPIQKSCIPAAAHQGKDIIGAAETGSGKTLAFVIPILQRLLEEEERCYVSSGNKKKNDRNRKNENGGPLCALIVTPTRELALQVCDHFRAAAKYTDIKVIPIVGGISAQKQERLLKQRPQAVVGTPGRLWELMSAGEQHLIELECLSFFVLDEADRMVEKGHFQELQSIISMLPVNQRSRNIISDQRRVQSECSIPKADGIVEVLSPDGSTWESCCADVDNWKPCKQRQTFVFSATLALPPGFRKKLKKEFLKVKESLKNEKWSVAALSERAGVRNSAAIFNLTSRNIVADKLEESIIQCREEEKDIYLYYILKLHGCGRAIVFCTSIAAVRRVAALLHLLQIPAWPLHGQMQQRQRLKAMDRFGAGENSVLVATDVAARGLDIQGIRTVIHYQLPHSAEVYVHRSGRTARASQDGCSVLLLCPSDQTKYNSLCHTLCKQDRLPIFPVNNAYMPATVRRIKMAKHVDSLLRKHKQSRAQASWFERNADALGMDIDDTGKAEKESDEVETCLSGKRASIQLKKLQQELKCLLEQPLEPRSISHQFVTGAGISPFVARQLKDFAKQKMFKRHAGSSKTGSKMGEGRKGLVVIGQETVEPLAALRTSFLM